MAIHVKTDNPKGLLEAIKSAIEEAKEHPNQEGVIKGWDVASDGDFFHVPDDWTEKLWLRPKVQTGELVFTVVFVKDTTPSRAILGHRQGQFSGMLVTHFPTLFTCTMLFP